MHDQVSSLQRKGIKANLPWSFHCVDEGTLGTALNSAVHYVTKLLWSTPKPQELTNA